MVVNGLYELMSHKECAPIFRRTVSITEEIKKWKSVHRGAPKILIDIKDIIHAGVQRDDIGQLLGGRYSLNTLYFRHFFRSLKQANVEMIFFVAAKTLSDDTSIFIPNREAEYIKYIEILDHIDANGGDTSRYLSHRHTIRAPDAMQLNLQKVAREFGEVRINYVRHNQEIARYAREHGDSVLAILSNDTDFMVFDGHHQFWHANDIDLNEMSVYAFDREKLCEYLELSGDQLQWLSALAGSMYLPCEVLAQFYLKIGAESYVNGEHIVYLACYIQNMMNLGSMELILTTIAYDIFGDECTPSDTNAIENGLIQYNLNFEVRTAKGLEFCRDRNMFIYKMICDDVYLVQDISYIDYRQGKTTNYAQLVLPLLRKVQGILCANEKKRPKTRSFCIKCAHDEPYTVRQEPIHYPLMKIPDWYVLVFETNNHKFEGVRWSLFDWVLNFDPKFKKSLQKLETVCLSVVVVTLKYLLQEAAISVDEADAILITEINTRRVYKNRIPRIDFPKKLNSHFIRIAHLYTKIYVIVRQCMEVCGLYCYTNKDYLMFDGRFFHQTMEKITASPAYKTEAMEDMENDRIYVES